MKNNFNTTEKRKACEKTHGSSYGGQFGLKVGPHTVGDLLHSSSVKVNVDIGKVLFWNLYHP